jgi:hypothetical protein
MNHDGKHCDACPMKCDHRIQKVVMVSVPMVRRAGRNRDEKAVTHAN